MYSDYPKVLDRIKSTLIDGVILIGCGLLFSEILALFTDVPQWVNITMYLCLWMYEPICIAFAATIGNDKMDIRVRRLSDETKRINIFQAVIRFLFKVLFGWLSFLTIFTNQRNRAIHDIVSGSVVVHA